MSTDDERIVIPDVRIPYDDHAPLFDDERALAQLLLDGVCYLNTGTYHNAPTICVFVICNDLFSWGTADAEYVTLAELETLYDMHMADPVWGSNKWCILHRKLMPQAPVLARMKERGVWDLDESLIAPNTLDTDWTARAAQAVSP